MTDNQSLTLSYYPGCAAHSTAVDQERSTRALCKALDINLHELEDWMTRHGFETVEQFRGHMSQDASTDPALYERVQFMKYFGGGEDTV